MKSIALLSLLAAVAVARQQIVLQPPSSVITDDAHSALDWFNDAAHKVQDAVSGVQSFERVHTEGIDCATTCGVISIEFATDSLHYRRARHAL